MKLIPIILVFAGLNASADSFRCTGENLRDDVLLNLGQDALGEYSADVSIYGRFSYGVSPAPLTQSFSGIEEEDDPQRFSSSDGRFALSGGNLQVNGEEFEVSCDQLPSFLESGTAEAQTGTNSCDLSPAVLGQTTRRAQLAAYQEAATQCQSSDPGSHAVRIGACQMGGHCLYFGAFMQVTENCEYDCQQQSLIESEHRAIE